MSCTSNNYTMCIKQGADYQLKLTIKDSANAPIDLTDHTFRGEIRDTASSADSLASFTFEKLDQITNTGEVLVKLTSAASSAIPTEKSRAPERTITKLAYDIESEANSIVTRWLEGVVELSPEVTKDVP